MPISLMGLSLVTQDKLAANITSVEGKPLKDALRDVYNGLGKCLLLYFSGFILCILHVNDVAIIF